MILSTRSHKEKTLLSFLLAGTALLGCPRKATNDPDAGPSVNGVADAGTDAGTNGGTDAGTDAGAPPAVGLSLLDYERGVDLTPDGRTALLWQQGTGALYFLDTVTGQAVQVTTLDVTDLQTQQPHAMSATRRIAAGYGFHPNEAALWSEAGGWQRLGSPLDAGCVDTSGGSPVVTDLSAAFDVSASGDVAVGFLWDGCNAGFGFRWAAAADGGVFTVLGKLGADGYERATVVASDGTVAAGFAPVTVGAATVDRSPARWNADGTGFLLDPTNAVEPGEVTAISSDGRTMAGNWASSLGGGQGFTWTADGGVVRFGSGSATPERDTFFVNAMSANGRFILGAVSTFDPDLLASTQSAFAWTEAEGVRPLADIATANGITLPADVTLANVMAVSADGTVILGDAALPPDPNDPLGQPVAKVFLLVLPASAVPE